MTKDKAREVTDADVAGLTGKLEEFASGLEPAERALLDALMSQAGGLGESEVEGFGAGSFRSASSAAFDPFKGGILSGDLLGGGMMATNWGKWSKTTGDGWNRDIDHQP